MYVQHRAKQLDIYDLHWDAGYGIISLEIARIIFNLLLFTSAYILFFNWNQRVEESASLYDAKILTSHE
jgi:hypothetical protein